MRSRVTTIGLCPPLPTRESHLSAPTAFSYSGHVRELPASDVPVHSFEHAIVEDEHHYRKDRHVAYESAIVADPVEKRSHLKFNLGPVGVGRMPSFPQRLPGLLSAPFRWSKIKDENADTWYAQVDANPDIHPRS